jgi:hypothetical protein
MRCCEHGDEPSGSIKVTISRLDLKLSACGEGHCSVQLIG